MKVSEKFFFNRLIVWCSKIPLRLKLEKLLLLYKLKAYKYNLMQQIQESKNCQIFFLLETYF
jgi:hypothetical protein